MPTHRRVLLILPLLLILSSCTVQPQSVFPSCSPHYESIDALLSGCPSDCELSAIDRDFSIVFDAVPSEYECVDGRDPTGGANPRLALYQLLRMLTTLQFDQPLPWTELSLYEWLEDTVDGFEISGAQDSHCCDDQGHIILSLVDLELPLPARWDSPHPGLGLCPLAGAIVHEARHAEVGPHTCGDDDTSPDELGPWGAQYYFYVWLAEHTEPGMLTDLQVQCAIAHAQMVRGHFCSP